MPPRFTTAQRASFERLISGQTKAPAQPSNLISTDYKANVKGWRTIGGKKYYFKSLWEINYAHYLEWLKVNDKIYDWEYEPQLFTFPKDAYKTGPFYYKPDFRVIEHSPYKGFPGRHWWAEVKGHMTPAAKKKDKRFRKHFPEEKILIVDSQQMASIRKIKKLIPGWEIFDPS